MKTVPFLLLSLPLLAAPFRLAAEERMLSEITVSEFASALEEQGMAVTQKTVIDRQAIEATGGLTVGDVLSKLPGVEAGVPSSDGTAALSSRGMVRDSVQVLVDGERPASNSRHAMLMISRLPAGELERVEIMKGATAEFGNAAPVSINLITNRARRVDRFSYKLSGGTRSGEPVTQLSLSKEGLSGPWSWTIPVSLNQTRTPVEKSTQRQNASAGTRTLWQEDSESGRNTFSEQVFAPKLNWKDGKSSFSLWPMFYRGEGERKSAIERAQYADPVSGTGLGTVLQRNDREDNRYRIQRLRMEGDTRVSGNKLSGRLSLMSGVRNTDIQRDSTGAWAWQSVQRRENEVNGAVRLDRGWGRHVTTLGLEHITLKRNEQQVYAGSYVDSGVFKASERQQALWVQDEWAASRAVTLTGGLRGESVVLTTDDASRQRSAISPSLAGRWDLDHGWLLRSSAGASMKAPKLDEISTAPLRSTSINSPLEPDRRGNPDLRPERSLSLEFGVERYWANDAGVMGINTYVRETRDFIERRPVLESSRWVERPYNEGDARHWGLELDGKFKTESFGLKGGAVRSHLTLPHAQVEDARLGIRRAAREVPRYIWSLGYDQSIPSLSSSAGFLLQKTGVTRSDVPSEQWAQTRGRSVLDAYWVRKLDRKLNLRFSLQNILGADLDRVVRAYSSGQEWQLASSEKQARVFLMTLEGQW